MLLGSNLLLHFSHPLPLLVNGGLKDTSPSPLTLPLIKMGATAQATSVSRMGSPATPGLLMYTSNTRPWAGLSWKPLSVRFCAKRAQPEAAAAAAAAAVWSAPAMDDWMTRGQVANMYVSQ